MSFTDKSQMTVLDVFREAHGMREVKGDFGIEIELEGTRLGMDSPPIKGWEFHNEGSLRAVGGRGAGGAEYVTRGAIKLEDVPGMVSRLSDGLRDNGVVIDDNAHRTSTHIHINVQKLKMLEMLGFMVVFTAVEPLVLALCGSKRDGNSFCIASYDSGDLPEAFMGACKQIEQHRPGYGFKFNRGKYASLGANRLHDFGTLEARCFPHSVSPEEIHTWCSWLSNIRDIVQKEDDKSFRTVIKEGLYNPLGLRNRVFGYSAIGMSDNLATELIQYGSREAYELTRILKRSLAKAKPEKEEVEEQPASPFPEELVTRAVRRARTLRQQTLRTTLRG